jgi:hypothetical protein
MNHGFPWPHFPLLLAFLVWSVGAAEAAEFLELQLLRRVLLVFGGRIISLLALGAGKRDDVSHFYLPLQTIDRRKFLA